MFFLPDVKKYAMATMVSMVFMGSYGVFAQDEASNTREVTLAHIVAEQAVRNIQDQYSFEMEVVRVFRPEQTPFAAVISSRKHCILVVNENPVAWKMWGLFTAAGNMSPVHSFRFASLHELGHCVNKLATHGSQPASADSELFADMFALKKTKELYGVAYGQKLALQVVKARKSQEHIFSPLSHRISSRLQEFTVELFSTGQNS